MALIQTTNVNDRKVGLWLLSVAGLVFLMIILGGATRLTQSGLSIVDWEPIIGAIPPLSEVDWQEKFEAYKAFPEYKILNRGMTLDEFKGIYRWEYAHRLLGRLIGLAFGIPLLVFLKKRRIREEMKITMFGLLALGGAQGLLGWYMVQSGLAAEPSVSQYRLAAHLGLALLIIAALFWVAMDLLRPSVAGASRRFASGAQALGVLVVLQMIFGAFVAGLDAGQVFNSWPTMADALVPAGLFQMTPWWINLFDNAMTVQFIHRGLAYLIVVAIMALIFSGSGKAARRSTKMALHALAGLIILQIFVGIITLLNAVPVGLGVLHQAVGVVVFIGAVNLVRECGATKSEV